MILRTYVVQMPDDNTPLDILVQSNPGTQDAPVTPVGGGAYYEVRGLSVRFPNPASDATSFVPRGALGFQITVTPAGNVGPVGIPDVQPSTSIASLASTDAGPSIAVPALADPNDEPVIRLIGDADTTDAKFYLVSLAIREARDADRSTTGAG